jgi:hypothetical protein
MITIFFVPWLPQLPFENLLLFFIGLLPMKTA